jgi:intracellular sulfur oxidation DsrE/DsrF family protein
MNTRKDFLLTSSLFALSPALADAASPSPSPAPAARGRKLPELTFDFDRARFDEILAKPAKHKQCFAATRLSDDVLDGMNNSIRAYEEYLKEGPAAMQAVAVLYHGLSIALAMDDAIWDELITPILRGKQFQSEVKNDPQMQRDVSALALGKGNAFLRSKTDDPDDVSIQRLVSKGCSFFVCHNAIGGFSGFVADALKLKREEVHRRLLAGIVPGALVVPAGVMAVNACQEAKFTYIQSSV